MSGSSIVNLGDLTKPASVLVEKISEAVGGVFKPYQMIRIAKAQAEVDQIQAGSQIQITDLQRRAMHRFLEEEGKKQSNIESITTSALPLLEENSAPENVQDDWITNFFDKSRIISDGEMQSLWSRVLAGEANAPGAFAKRTVNLLADLDKEDAALFTQLCGFGWDIGSVCPLVFDVKASIYTNKGITFGALSHLESLGLIQCDHIAGFARLSFPKSIRIYYYGQPVVLTFPQESANELNIGHVLLTRAGQQLAPVSAPKPVGEFFEYVKAKWVAQSLIPKPDLGATTAEADSGG